MEIAALRSVRRRTADMKELTVGNLFAVLKGLYRIQRLRWSLRGNEMTVAISGLSGSDVAISGLSGSDVAISGLRVVFYWDCRAALAMTEGKELMVGVLFGMLKYNDRMQRHVASQ